MGRNVSFDFLANDKASATATRLGENIDELGRKIDRAGGTIEVDADISRAEAKIARLNAQNIQVDADTRAAERKLAVLEAEAKTATGDRKLEVDADIEQARAKLARLSATKLTIDADVNDADLKLDALRRKRDELERQSSRRSGLNIDVDGAVASLDKVGQRFRNIRALASVPVTLSVGVAGMNTLSSVARALPGLMGVGVSLAGSAGVAVGALKGIGEAVTALGEKDTTTASKMQSNARSVASAIHGVELAHRGVRDAQQVVADAQYNLTQANRDALSAERDLNDARERAIENLRDLSRREDDMQASRASAAISVLEAQERLNQVMVDPRASDTQRARAALNLAEAKRRVQTLAEDEKKLKAEKADAVKKGVDGSDEVQAALQRQVDAQRRVEESARAVQKAQEGVRDAAWQLRDAQAAVREASQKTGEVGSASMNRLQEAMAGLTPEAQRFAKYLRGVLDGPIAEWRKTAQRAFLPGLQKGLEGMFANMPNMNSSIKTLGENLGKVAEKIGPSLGKAIDAFGQLAAKVSDQTWEQFADVIIDILDRFTKWANSKSPEDIQADLEDLGETIGDIRYIVEEAWRWTNFLIDVWDSAKKKSDWLRSRGLHPVTVSLGDLYKRLKYLRDNWGPAWDWMKTKGGEAKTWLTKNVFDRLGKATDDLGADFRRLKNNIGKHWDAIKEKAKTPVRFVIDTVMGGLARKFNSISEKIGGPTLPVPKSGFAAGGVLPGYTPGRDVHQFYSPTAGSLALSGGEAVMRPEFTKAVGGAKGVERLNKLAREGQLGELVGGIRGFAGGGVLDFIKGKAASAFDWVTDKASSLYKAATNPGAYFSRLGAVPGSGLFSEVGRAAANSIVGSAVSKLTGLWGAFKGAFDDYLPAGGGGSGMGWQAQAAWIRKNLPGVAITSTYRPGAKTVSGNTSYHARGRAIDLAPSMSTFNAIRNAFGSSIAELIYSPAGGRQLKNGRPYLYGGPVRAQHWNHVHWAMKNGGVFDNGGMLQPGLSTVYNGTGRPEPVLTSSQWDNVQQVASAGRGAGTGMTVINVTVPNAVIGNEAQVAKTVVTSVKAAINNGTLRFNR